MGTTHFKEDLDVGGTLTVGSNTNGGSFKLPSLTTVQRLALSPEVGMHVYDTTLGVDYVYREAGWGNTNGTAAASLDAGYNGGYAITVDAGAVTLNDATTSTQGTLLLTKSGAVTGSDSATVLYVNSTGAHDTSGTVTLLKLVMGTETATTPVGETITMNANGDTALDITKGAVVMTDGALTLTSGALTLSSGNLTLSSGNLSVTGTGAISSTLTVSGAFTADSTAVVDVTNANAFKVRKNGAGTTIFNIDNTGDAGDTTFTLVSETTSGIGASFTVANTTGSGLYIDGSTVTSGDAVLIKVVSGTMSAAGSAISVIDGSTEVFAVRDDGSIYSKATAEGTTAFQVVTGDVLISDGDFTVSGGESSFTDGISTSGIGFTVISSATTAGVGAGTAGPFVLTANSLTTGTALVVRCDAITSGDMLYLDAGTSSLNGGYYINCNDDNASDFTVGNYGATVITGDAAGTAALTLTAGDLVLTDTDTTTITSVNGTGNTVEIISGGAVGAGKGTLVIDQAGTLNATGSLLRLEADGVTATNTPYAMVIDCSGVDMAALTIDSDAATDNAVVIHGSGAVANDRALLELDWDGTPANAGSNMLRVDGSGGTNTVKPVLVEVLDDSVSTCLSLSSAPTANNVAIMTGTGALTDGYAVLHVTSSGALATGGNTLKVSTTGTPASGAIYAEFDFSGITDTNENIGLAIDGHAKKVQGLWIDCDPVATSTAYIHTDGAIAADKAVLEVDSNASTSNADSSVVRVVNDNTGSVSMVMTLKQDDIDEPIINFEGTSAANQTASISTVNGDGTAQDIKNYSSSAGWTFTGMIRCAVNGTDAWIPYYVADVS